MHRRTAEISFGDQVPWRPAIKEVRMRSRRSTKEVLAALLLIGAVMNGGPSGDPTALYFAAGPDDEENGYYGRIDFQP